jgi:predicted NAD-dependent protein-ADP-ribosyltransferase YbiA (DUF1768 family)
MAWIKNWFSNMLPCDEPFYYTLYHTNAEFKTVENFYQAMKANTDEEFCRIAAMNPFQAKNYWRKYEPYPITTEDKLNFMEYGLRKKFAPGTSWFNKLMKTEGDIVEWNNWGDRYWGVDVRDKKGENHLGKILMKIRDEHTFARTGKKYKKIG